MTKTIFYCLILLVITSCNEKKKNAENETSENQSEIPIQKTLTSEETNDNILGKYVSGGFIVATLPDNPISYHPNGVIRSLRLITKETNNVTDLYNDNEHKKSLDFDEKGQLMSLNERIGRKYHGTQLTYYATGQIHTITNYDMGNKEGEDILYKMDGSIFISENFIGGKRNGTSVRYNDENKLISKVEYKNGIAFGNSFRYFDNGKVEQSCSDGEDFRFCKSYHENGKISSEIKYNLNTGHLISKVYFDEEGNIREEHNYDQNGNVESNSNAVQSFDEKGNLIK
jgi:antitoxin component YwqK of YwqJK toxin-antitoxin module